MPTGISGLYKNTKGAKEKCANPRINIGDKVYMVIENQIEEFEIDWVKFIPEQCEYAYRTKKSEPDMVLWGFFDSDIGKCVFLTREEAELVGGRKWVEREILIELIIQAKKHTKNANCDIERNMIFADYLLANGVKVEIPNNSVSLVDGHIEE